MADQFNDVMVDVETTGLNYENTAVIQVAAVKFNLKERAVDSSSMFNRCLSIPPRRYWDEGTRHWWSEQKREVLQDIYSRMEDPKTVMEEFATWAGYSPSEPLRFWAKPAHFDYSFISSYFSQFEIPNPFHYRYVTDLNSYIRGLAKDPTVESFRVDFDGDAHNALYDVIHQIKTAFGAADAYANV